MHYNEFQAVKLARQLIENEDDDEGDDDNDGHMASASGDLPGRPHESVSSAAADCAQHTEDTEASDMLRKDML